MKKMNLMLVVFLASTTVYANKGRVETERASRTSTIKSETDSGAAAAAGSKSATSAGETNVSKLVAILEKNSSVAKPEMVTKTIEAADAYIGKAKDDKDKQAGQNLKSVVEYTASRVTDADLTLTAELQNRGLTMSNLAALIKIMDLGVNPELGVGLDNINYSILTNKIAWALNKSSAGDNIGTILEKGIKDAKDAGAFKFPGADKMSADEIRSLIERCKGRV